MCCQYLHHKSDRACNSNHLIMVGNLGLLLSVLNMHRIYHNLILLDVNVFCICVAGMNMLGGPRTSGMDSYGSWPGNDSRVMQHNPSMNNPQSKYHTTVLLYAFTYLHVPQEMYCSISLEGDTEL